MSGLTATQDYLNDRSTDVDLEQMNSDLDAAREEDAKQLALERAGLAATLKQSEPGLVSLGRNGLIAAYDAVRNTAEAVVDAGSAVAGSRSGGAKPGEPETPDTDLADLFPDFIQAADQFRDKLAKGSTGQDVFAQKLMQFAVPFAAALKVAKVGQSVSTAAKVGKIAAADAVVSATVWDPQEGRFADLLREMAPNNALVARFTDYLVSDPNDSDAEGRWKNVLDSQAVGAVAGPLLYGAGKTMKSVRDAVREIAQPIPQGAQ